MAPWGTRIAPKCLGDVLQGLRLRGRARADIRMHRRIAFSALLLFLLSGRVALAEGAVSGRVSAPEGTKLADIKIVLNPEKARSGRLTVHPSKKGEFFFGIVPQGTWTLTVEGTDLAPSAIKVLVYDNEKRKE